MQIKKEKKIELTKANVSVKMGSYGLAPCLLACLSLPAVPLVRPLTFFVFCLHL